MSNETIYPLAQKYLAPIIKRYGRISVVGDNYLPPTGQGALLACNHSGSFWWDAMCLIAGLRDRRIQFIAHHWDARIPAIKSVLQMVDCSFLDERLEDITADSEVINRLQAGEQMCIYPEESYHSFRERYTLFKFSPHVAKYAAVAKVPIIPIAVIGAEEAAPTLFGLKKAAVPLHIPFHPPLILPVKITLVIGKPIAVDVSDQLNAGADSADAGYEAAAEQIRQSLFEMIGHYRNCSLKDEKYIERSSWF